jgi:hypothetical protein
VQPVPPVEADELDAAIREASTYLNGRVPGNSKAVFLNIRSDYPDLSEYILNVLSENAVNDGVFSVVDRQQLDTIRAELNFQMSGEVSDESAQSIGQMLGAQTIVSGAVSKIGSLHRIQVKAIEVQSAGVQGQWSRNVPNGATIAALTERYAPASSGAIAGGTARSGVSGGTAAQAQVPTAPAAPPTPVYKIGDEGPAGGIIFFDKFSNAGGWRYLEAAPKETEQSFPWGSAWAVYDTTIAIGAGKNNTELILAEMKKNGIFVTAAQFCGDLEYGGYDDWFLPSRDELNLMYENLKAKGLGDFTSDLYWSSSDVLHSSYAWAQRFSNGVQLEENYNGPNANSLANKVRACRQF